VHRAPSSLYDGPDDVAQNDDDDDVVAEADSPDLNNRRVTVIDYKPDNNTNDDLTSCSASVNDAELSSERDCDDEMDFPSPPPSAVNGGDLAVIVTTGQHDNIDMDRSVSKPFSTVPADPVTVSLKQPAQTVEDVAPPDTDLCPPLPPLPPPPPAPLLPANILIPKPSADAGIRQTPSRTQQQVEEMKQRDANHAALMAAVARRKNILDSTDGEQVAKSIEDQLRRNTKVQTVFRASGNAAECRSATVAPSSLLAPTGKPDAQKVVINGE